ncbi:hypothetical protein [Streptomyces sp. NPDC005953]|uniref:hypothetical protein n=1 Tax=Streptomyces sp. NPDC005953 TaxID=3156719 RepID=UPI0033DB6095
MTSIERTAYPRFKRLITAHELHLFFSPTRDEHLLDLLQMLKPCQRMGCFPRLKDIPNIVVDFARRPAVITDDMLHTVLRRRANDESVEQIQPDLIIPTG